MSSLYSCSLQIEYGSLQIEYGSLFIEYTALLQKCRDHIVCLIQSDGTKYDIRF